MFSIKIDGYFFPKIYKLYFRRLQLAIMPKPCFFGDKCRNMTTCPFGHPKKANRDCRYGSNCRNKATCRFEHPSGHSSLNPQAHTFVPANVETSVPTWEEMNADMEELDILMEIETSDPFARLDDDVEEDDDPNGDTVYYQ